MPIKSEPRQLEYSEDPVNCDLLIVAAGFEDRAYKFLRKSTFSSGASCVLITFEYDIPENNEIHEKFRKTIANKFDPEVISEAKLEQDNPRNFEKNFFDKISKKRSCSEKIWIDISGMPTHVICSVLRIVRELLPNKEQTIVYTSAEEYYPSLDEYEQLRNSQQNNDVEFLPPSMALEMSEVFMLESFSGHRSREGTTCLAVFAGYDVPRSSGVIDNINPAILLLLYGNPAGSNMDWRYDLSKNLHKRFEQTRKTATEAVSTLNPNESLDLLEEYYEYLFEDYDFTISPVCSKMQTVAVYLFWEKYKEVQLAFPMPIGYSTERKPKGASESYVTLLNPRNSLFRINNI